MVDILVNSLGLSVRASNALNRMQIHTLEQLLNTITLPEGGNYIGIECEDFTGSIELNVE